MTEQPYFEKVQSLKTSLLFVTLMLVFSVLFVWRVTEVGYRFFPVICLIAAMLFLFYVINYRTLKIEITEEVLALKFGLVGWKSRLDNIQACQLDDSPIWIKYGGAGVHFALVFKKYRAFFNFLEYPRVLITFHRKQGLVQALTFTTRQPDKVLAIINSRIEKNYE
ncbi:MAG: hypothetical protein WBB69_13380 [Anaerolineales bacterium]